MAHAAEICSFLLAYASLPLTLPRATASPSHNHSDMIPFLLLIFSSSSFSSSTLLHASSLVSTVLLTHCVAVHHWFKCLLILWSHHSFFKTFSLFYISSHLTIVLISPKAPLTSLTLPVLTLRRPLLFEQHDCHFIIFISHFFTCYPLKKNQHFPQPIYLSLYSVSKQSLTLVPLFLIPFFPSSSAALPEDRAGAARQNSQHVRMFPYSSSAAAAALLNLSALALHHLPFTPPYMLSLRILHRILFVTF